MRHGLLLAAYTSTWLLTGCAEPGFRSVGEVPPEGGTDGHDGAANAAARGGSDTGGRATGGRTSESGGTGAQFTEGGGLTLQTGGHAPTEGGHPGVATGGTGGQAFTEGGHPGATGGTGGQAFTEGGHPGVATGGIPGHGGLTDNGGAPPTGPTPASSCPDDDTSCNGESCCLSLPVPGGTYGRTADPAALDSVHDYYLDKYEVTVGRFRRFLEAYEGPPATGAGEHPLIPDTGWQAHWGDLIPSSPEEISASLHCDEDYSTWTPTPGDNETLPLNCATWHLAFAFCVWDGGRLPTEQEYTYAAAGGDEDRTFPWAGGDGWDGNHAAWDCMGDGVEGCAFSDIPPVGSFPAGNGKWGHADLAGSMWEMVFDFYDEEFPFDTICRSCANTTLARYRTMVGGGWEYDATYGRMDSFDPFMTVGWRCARD